MKSTGDLRIEYAPLTSVKRWPRNPKLHDLDKIEASIERHGFVAPAVEDARTGRFVAGHGRLETLERMKAAGKPAPRRILVKGKEWMIPVLRGVAFESEAQAEEYLLADNRVGEVGGWNPKALAEVMQTWSEGELAQLGWTLGDLERLAADGGASASLGAQGDGGGGDSGIRQIVLRYTAAEFETVMARLEKAYRKLKANDHTEVFMGLLDFYEAHRR